MRNMSFSLTEPQLRDRSKTVTRRLGWERLKPGDRVCAVRKAMGLRRGEKIHKLAIIEIVSVRREPLMYVDADDCRREGFPGMTKVQFVNMFCDHMGCDPDDEVTRIEFKIVQWLDNGED